MATLEEVKAAFNALATTDSPESLRTQYAAYRIDTGPYGYFMPSIVDRDIYQFDSRFLAMEWSVPREGYTIADVPPAARAYEVQQHIITNYTYTEIL